MHRTTHNMPNNFHNRRHSVTVIAVCPHLVGLNLLASMYAHMHESTYEKRDI